MFVKYFVVRLILRKTYFFEKIKRYKLKMFDLGSIKRAETSFLVPICVRRKGVSCGSNKASTFPTEGYRKALSIAKSSPGSEIYFDISVWTSQTYDLFYKSHLFIYKRDNTRTILIFMLVKNQNYHSCWLPVLNYITYRLFIFNT